MIRHNIRIMQLFGLLVRSNRIPLQCQWGKKRLQQCANFDLGHKILLPSTPIQLSARILTVVTLQVLGLYVLFGRNCLVGVSSLVGLISPLHACEATQPHHSVHNESHGKAWCFTMFFILEYYCYSMHSWILLCTLRIGIMHFLLYIETYNEGDGACEIHYAHNDYSLASHMVSIAYSSAYTHSACTALTCTKSASQFAPCCANIHSESVLNCWVKVVNQHTGISGVDSVDSTCNLSNFWRRLICHKVHRKPSCLMEGEWGPTNKGTSVVVHPLHLYIAHLDSGSCTVEEIVQQGKYSGLWIT